MLETYDPVDFLLPEGIRPYLSSHFLRYVIRGLQIAWNLVYANNDVWICSLPLLDISPPMPEAMEKL